MRLIMMGTGPFAVPTFQSLLASTHEVSALVTRPSAAIRTHRKVQSAASPMRDIAQRHGLRILDPEDVNSVEAREELRRLNPDLLVVCDYGQILSAETLGVSRLGGINLHGSLLPKYRGAAPVNWAIWRGETETGVTVLHMTTRLDAGPSLAQATTAIGPEETAAELELRLARLGVEPVQQAIASLAAWDGHSPLGVPQDPSLASKAPRLRKSHGRVDWRRPAEEIIRQFRALQPWPGLFTQCRIRDQEPLRLILLGVRATAEPSPHEPGQVAVADGRQLIVAAGRDAVAIERLQPAGRKALDVAEFLRGYPVRPGDRWGDGDGGTP